MFTRFALIASVTALPAMALAQAAPSGDATTDPTGAPTELQSEPMGAAPAGAPPEAAQGELVSETGTEAAFALPELPYAVGALAPVIDAQTMELHRTKHQQTFVDNLNKAVAAGDIDADQTLEQILANAGDYPAGVRNSAGGHWNHSFFWPLMAPVGEGGELSEPLNDAITASFGSLDEFKAAFEAAGAQRFGSGWVWLIVNDDDELEITSTPNQDNPLMSDADVTGIPVLGNDVWEHAYYLTYQNRRPEYLSNWWDVVNWTQVSQNYATAIAD